ncbi:hypothetical protein JVT61DRAFT_2718 [Boletus reticuloceps]|uniref:Uncharacterized protein n=1 Tax=Boletus reticuloceps TaxID=495285 RepID=A0A8I3AA30_9AGAM|nr:hypothetical protein JVT61DRAFT_2718 [Boletus reticuloceps]
MAMIADNERVYRFPPFPAPPEGVTIVPFSVFKPEGYRRVTDPSGGESIEVDAWAGIPTVKGNATDPDGKLIPWWQEWEEGEALRAMSQASFDSRASFEDRVSLAADDFRVGRTWPEIAQGVRYMWDQVGLDMALCSVYRPRLQFRLYIGLISSIPVYKKVKNKQKGQVDGPNDGAEEASDEEEDAPKAKQTKVDIVQDFLEQSALPGKQLEPNLDNSTAEAQRLRAFLD